MNQKERAFLIEDQSQNPAVYQLFDLVVTGGTEDLSNGTVNLLPSGLWDYTLLEATGTTISAITDNALEYGVANVID